MDPRFSIGNLQRQEHNQAQERLGQKQRVHRVRDGRRPVHPPTAGAPLVLSVVLSRALLRARPQDHAGDAQDRVGLRERQLRVVAAARGQPGARARPRQARETRPRPRRARRPLQPVRAAALLPLARGARTRLLLARPLLLAPHLRDALPREARAVRVDVQPRCVLSLDPGKAGPGALHARKVRTRQRPAERERSDAPPGRADPPETQQARDGRRHGVPGDA
mmetsp:Transcript_29923/g.71218  ORF Transcript_29923/g.71218 Transcript_29923/m.71218 type:complete len:222 (+) Transcript_29923:587-1252(+)